MPDRAQLIEAFIDKNKEKIWNYLDKYDIQEAFDLYHRCKPVMDNCSDAIDFALQFVGKLQVYDFVEAERLLSNANSGDQQRYRNYKAYFIGCFLRERFNFDINSEQAHAITTSMSTLVSARAGSGHWCPVISQTASTGYEYRCFYFYRLLL